MYETQIFHESNESKVKKLQQVFSGLGLYTGEINGIYADIEKTLIDYQLKKGIVEHHEADGAGYFGAKTMQALEDEFGTTYLKLKEEFLKVDNPNNTGHFIVTAYYSPLPGQAKYTTGTYAGDIRLNGDGNNTASGKGMYAGLLAGPRNYAFGTKIYLEGIGIGEIGDRGGAIVNSGERGHEHDRLDIWVGYGDEGRERARQWGIRTIPGFVINDGYEVNIEFDESPITKYRGLTFDPNNPKVEDVEKLQNLGKELGLYTGEVDGIFESVIDSFIEYQISRGIIPHKDSEHAGYFGPKTFEKLQEEFGKSSGLFIEKHILELERELYQSGDKALPMQYDKVLTDKEKAGLHVVKNKLDNKFSQITRGDQTKIQKLKTDFKVILEEIIRKDKYMNRKYEFKYLMEIL